MPRRLIIPEFRRFISRKGYRRYALARARSRPLLLIAARNDKVGRLIFKNCPPLTNISGRVGQHPPWLHRSRCPEKYTSRLCRPIRVQCRDRTVDRAARVSWLKIKRVGNKKKKLREKYNRATLWHVILMAGVYQRSDGCDRSSDAYNGSW